MSQEKDKMHYDFIEHTDFLSESFTLPIFNYAKDLSTDQISMLSLFSGCGGMDIGFEGGFICHRKSVP